MTKSRTSLAEFPDWDKTKNIKKANRACVEMYSPQYVGMTVYNRDKMVALEASDNNRCWWIYEFLMYNPFRTTHK